MNSDAPTSTDVTAIAPKPEVVAFLSKTIRYDMFYRAFDAIKATHAMAGVVGTGMLLLGQPGVGKTTVLNYYVKKYLASRTDLESDELTKKPVLYVTIPPKPNIKNLVSAILCAGKHREPINGTELQMARRLSVFIEKQGVELIIFDEFQQLLREQAQISTRNVLNFIKVLMDQHKLAIVMAGIENAYDAIAQFEELYQRFTYEQVYMTPFDISYEDEFESFRDYLKSCEAILKEIGVTTVTLSSELMLHRIYLATDGKLRLLSRLIAKAMDISDSDNKLTLEEFREVCNLTRLNPKLKGFNPFAAPKDKVMHKYKEYVSIYS